MVARSKIEKPSKPLSFKRELEAEHLVGKHNVKDENMAHAQFLASENPECGFCQRRVKRFKRKNERTHAYFASGGHK